MAYREGDQVKSRAKFGFAMKDIINNLPGAGGEVEISRL